MAESMPFPRAVDSFIKHMMSRDKSKETIRGYSLELAAFNRWLERRLNGKLYLDEVTLELMEEYLQFRKGKGDAAVSRNRIIYILRSFYGYCQKRDLISRNDTVKLEPAKVNQRERDCLTMEEIAALIEAMETPLMRAVVFTLSDTGLRISEMTSLTLDDVDLEAGVIRVLHGKGGKFRIVPINDKLKIELINYLDNVRPQVASNRFFVTAKTGQLSSQWVNRCLKKAAANLGWDKHLTAHVLRHSFASSLVRRSAPLPAVQMLLGHSDLRVTSRYLHQNLDELKDAVNLL